MRSVTNLPCLLSIKPGEMRMVLSLVVAGEARVLLKVAMSSCLECVDKPARAGSLWIELPSTRTEGFLVVGASGFNCIAGFSSLGGG